MRAARVSGVFAAATRCRIAYRLALFRVAKNADACGWASGTVAVAWLSYAASQRPSAFAASIAARPAGRMRPVAISSATLPWFTFDQRLFGRRGVKRASQ